MLRMIVIVLLAGNFLLAGFHVAGSHDLPAPSPAPLRALPADIPGIELISEMAPVSTKQAPGRICFSAGPFETRRSLQAARAALRPGSLVVSERTTQALMELGYWVALPVVPGFAQAAAAEQELRKAGVEDVAVVTNKDGEVTVSLGYFLDENNARRRREEVRALGFEATTRLQRDSQERYWLDYQWPASLDDGDAPRMPEFHRAIPCPDLT